MDGHLSVCADVESLEVPVSVFCYLFKNERLKNKILEDFDTIASAPKDKIFDVVGASSLFIDLFDQNSCCIHTELR